MKRVFRLSGIITIFAIIGFGLSACKDTDTSCSHTFNLWQETTAPTCTAAGEDTEKCSKCSELGTKKQVGAVALGHQDLIPAFAATCTAAGNSEESGTCTRTGCGQVLIGTVINALGHQGINAVEATCTGDGNSGSGNCTRAGCVVTGTVIPALGHEGLTAAFAATCTIAGNSEESGTCTRAGCVVSGTVINALGHFFNNRKCAELCFNFGMVLVEKGTFTMGPDVWNGNATVQVTFTKDFRMSKYQVTQELYQTVMGVNPSNFSSDPADGELQGRRPVEMVTWFDTLDFCNKLSEAEGLEPVYMLTDITTAESNGITRITGATVIEDFSKNGYRLPTDAQWEYAAKGGNGSPGNFTYSGSNNADEVAWHSGNSGSMTREVGKKAPNELGIYDMSGNVWEWCWDWFGNYPAEPVTDYTGAVSGSYFIERGGCWHSMMTDTRSVVRSRVPVDGRGYALGFRLVRP